jgi:hypothetical protein
MSVDDTLREAFGEETWDVETGAALRQVHARARRARVWKGGALAAAAAALALVAGGALVNGGRDQGAPGPAQPGHSRAADSSTPHHSTAPTPLDGTWRIGPVTTAQIRATLRQGGEGRWFRTVIRDLPPPPVTYWMTIHNGRVDVRLAGRGGTRYGYDQEYLTVSGRRAILEPRGNLGVNRYRWALEGGRLRLMFLSTSEGGLGVNPNAAFQRALYSVAEWTRTPPAG